MAYSTSLGKTAIVFLGVLLFGILGTQNIAYAQTDPVLSLDRTPPVFDAASDIFVEATSGDGTIVNYDIPSATDNVEVNSVSCNPPPNSLFALGKTIVICVAIDTSGNQASKTFSIFVQDTTPPEISVFDLTFDATGILTFIELDPPSITDLVDPFPIVKNNATESFEIGTTTIIWEAIDSAGNSSVENQLITLSLPAPVLEGPSEIVSEATLLETPSSDIEFDVTANSSLEFILNNDSPEFFPLGTTPLTWTMIDAADNVVNLNQEITLVDTTAPEIELEFVAYSLNKDGNSGTFSVSYNVRDAVDFAPVTMATINDVQITNNQFVNLILDNSKSGVKEKQGLLTFSGTEFVLKVMSADFSGNENIASATAAFQVTPPEIPIQDIPITELTMDDLQELLNNLETIPPSNLDNLGQELKQIKHVADLLFEQEKNSIKNLKEELKQRIKDTDGDTKELKKEYADIIKQTRNDFKSMQKQYKDAFSEYKTTAKLILKENKGLKSHNLENELKKIESKYAQNEDDRTKKLDEEKIQKQKEQDDRTDELYNMLMARIDQNSNMHNEQKIYNSIQKLVTDDVTSKDKQKLMKKILKSSDKSIKEGFKDAKNEIKKNEKELKKSLKLQEKELKLQEKELKKIEKEQHKLSKLHEKELKKIEKELKKIEKEQKKELDKQLKNEKKIQKQLAEKSKELEKQLKKDAKKAEKEAKKEAKKKK